MAAAFSLGIMPQLVRRVIDTTEIAIALPDPGEIARVMSEFLLHGIARQTEK
jgi:hypothetical protein